MLVIVIWIYQAQHLLSIHIKSIDCTGLDFA